MPEFRSVVRRVREGQQLRIVSAEVGRTILIILGATAFLWLYWRLVNHLDLDGEDDFLLAGFCHIVAGLSVLAGLAKWASWPRRVILCWVLAIVTAASIYIAAGRATFRDFGESGQLKMWSTFHYYLGSKYFAELGYRDLYPAVLRADVDGARRFEKVKSYRDMATYRLADAQQARNAARGERWTDARWRRFVKDVKRIGKMEAKDYWRGPLSDRGYNATPTWTFFGSLLTSHLEIHNLRDQAILVAADPLLISLAFAVSVWAFGLTRSLVVLAGIALWYGSKGWLVGRVFQYDWLAATWAGLAFLSRRHFVTAGVLLAYASCSRIFPAAFVVGPMIQFGHRWWRDRKIPEGLLRLCIAGVCTAILCVSAGAMTGRGWAAWTEFYDNISLHNSHHVLGDKRVGLVHLMTLDIESGLEGEHDQGDSEIELAENRLLVSSMRVVAVAFCVWAMLRTNTLNSALYGCILIYFCTISSRYYAAVHALLLLCGVSAHPRGPPVEGRRWIRPTPRVALDVAFFAISAWVHFAVDTVSDAARAYLWGNFLLLAFFVGHLWVGVRMLPKLDPEASRKEPPK